MSTFRQFRDIPDPIATFDRLFRDALGTLLRDLADAPWYVRDREVVNLFVFGHLIPHFQTEKLDIRQVGIEVPVRKSRKTAKEKLGKYADIVVWPHNKATLWRRCRPLVHIEWKNISCRERKPPALEREHEEDICSLMENREFVSVSYAVLTDWRNRRVEVRCKRVVDGEEVEDFFAPTSGALARYPAGIEVHQTVAANKNVWCLRCAATCQEGAIADLQGSLQPLLLGPQACLDCITLPKRALAGEALDASGREAFATEQPLTPQESLTEIV
jgi:hypothetical protein